MPRQFHLMLILLTITLLTSAAAAQTNPPLQGIWQSIGYGLWFDITAQDIHVYQASQSTCLPMLNIQQVEFAADGQSAILHGATIAGLGQFMGAQNYPLRLQNGLISLEVGKLNPIQAEPAEALPALCANPTTNTPLNNFDTFWQVFNENYAFFDLHKVDWQQAYDHYRPMVTESTSDADLFAIFKAMLTPFSDSHVSISSMIGAFAPSVLPDWAKDIQQSDFETYARIPEHYLTDAVQSAANDKITYGHLSPTVGYISLTAFTEFSDNGNDEQALRDAMDSLVQPFHDLKSIVVDIRFNGGGDDSLGLMVAGYFADAAHPAYRKSVWDDGVFHPLMDVAVQPTTPTPFTGKVYLLTSGITVSAAETFTLAMRTLPNVTQVGETTNGSLSDMWLAVLPNGWIATLSNEQYLTPDGTLYEGKGIPPQVDMPIQPSDLQHAVDPQIEWVLQQAG